MDDWCVLLKKPQFNLNGEGHKKVQAFIKFINIKVIPAFIMC